jgi:Flp pilus assembly protein TadG
MATLPLQMNLESSLGSLDLPGSSVGHSASRPWLRGLLTSLPARLSSEEGGSLVEASATLTLLLMIIFGIMDCSRALYADHYVRYTAEEAVRYAQVRGSTWNNTPCSTPATLSCTATAANIQSQVASVMPAGIDSGTNLTVVTSWTGLTPTGAACSVTNGANSPGCMVQVKVSYSFNFVLPFLPANALVLSSTSASPITQ